MGVADFAAFGGRGFALSDAKRRIIVNGIWTTS